MQSIVNQSCFQFRQVMQDAICLHTHTAECWHFGLPLLHKIICCFRMGLIYCTDETLNVIHLTCHPFVLLFIVVKWWGMRQDDSCDENLRKYFGWSKINTEFTQQGDWSIIYSPIHFRKSRSVRFFSTYEKSINHLTIQKARSCQRSNQWDSTGDMSRMRHFSASLAIR